MGSLHSGFRQSASVRLGSWIFRVLQRETHDITITGVNRARRRVERPLQGASLSVTVSRINNFERYCVENAITLHFDPLRRGVTHWMVMAAPMSASAPRAGRESRISKFIGLTPVHG
jgi:hypothetical protein